jgi:hypothetical protein
MPYTATFFTSIKFPLRLLVGDISIKNRGAYEAAGGGEDTVFTGNGA